MSRLIQWTFGRYDYDLDAQRYRVSKPAVTHSPQIFDAVLELDGRVSDAVTTGAIQRDGSAVAPVSVALWILARELTGPEPIPTWSKSVRFGH